MDDFLIRRASTEDTLQIGQLWEELVMFHHNIDPALPKAAKEGGKLYARSLADRVDDTHTGIFVAEANGKLVGFILGVVADMIPEMFEQKTGGFLADIFVAEEYRQQGVGRQLVEALIGWFRNRGVRHVEWYVAAENDIGRAFWQSIGGKDVMIRMRTDF